MYKLTVAFVSLFFLFTAPVGAAGASDQKWVVTQLSGDARVLRPGLQPASLTVRAQLSPGDRLVTGPTGRATLVKGADYIVVAPRSEMRVPVAAQPTGFTRVVQTLGTLLFKVKHTGVPHFAVDTPMLAAVVKGTTFTVTVDQQRSAIQVTQGLVQVTAVDGGMMRLVEGGRTVFLNHLAPKDLLDADKPLPTSPTPAATGVTVSAESDAPLAAIATLTDGLVRADLTAQPAVVTATTNVAAPVVENTRATTATAQPAATSTAAPTAATIATTTSSPAATTVTASTTVSTPAAAPVAAILSATPTTATVVATTPVVSVTATTPATTPSVSTPVVSVSTSAPVVTAPVLTTTAVATPTVTVPTVTTPVVSVNTTAPVIAPAVVTTTAVTTPTVTVPAVTTPVVSTPAVTLPTITIGSNSGPSGNSGPGSMPSGNSGPGGLTSGPVTVAAVTVPTITTPTVTVPTVTTPTVTVPSVTAPIVPITTPTITVPAVSTPVLTVTVPPLLSGLRL